MAQIVSTSDIAYAKWHAAEMESLRSVRLSWWQHWALLAEQYSPRLYRWFVTPNKADRGAQLNGTMVDETGLLASRVLATGMLAGLTSPTKPWFTLTIDGEDSLPQGPAQLWLSQVTNILLQIFSNSNFYQVLGEAYTNLVIFGSALVLAYEDRDNVLHYYTAAMGEFFFALNAKQEVDTIYREFTYTVSQAVNEFGLDNVSTSTREAYQTPAGRNQEVVIGHCICPNNTVYEGREPVPWIVAPSFKYREVYWEAGNGTNNNDQTLLRAKGFAERPFMAFRWDTTSNDPYGRSPGMDALPANRQLQIQARRLAEGIDKLVRPPMVASVGMKNEPMDTMPGGISYVADMNGAGFKPAYQVEPRVQELAENQEQTRDRVRKIFFNDLFQGISNLGTVRTATEIEARQQETLVQIGPVIERTENELDKGVDRAFLVALRRKLFPPAPPEIQGRNLQVRYVSLFAETQRAAATTAIERLLGVAGNLFAVQPDVLDNIDTDATIEEYAKLLNVSPKLIRSVKQIMAIRAQREQAQQQQASLQTGVAAAQGAATLSKADLGNGKNALQAMVGA